MAQNQPPKNHSVSPPPSKPKPNLALQIIQVVGSLKVTVALFVLSLILVFFGTVVQTYYGIDRVMREYFHSWIVHIEFRLIDTFFERFFIEFGWPKSKPIDNSVTHNFSTFPFPAGFTLGWAMVLNLTAAHVVMFIKLYRQYQTAQRQADRQRELNPTLENEPLSGGSLFTKLLLARSGIYILHFGVILLLFGEYVRATQAHESRMMIYEGRKVGFTEDFHKTELAFIDVTDPNATTEKVVVIPHQLLMEAARDQNPNAAPITHPEIPFSIEVLSWYRNTTPLKTAGPDDPSFLYSGQRVTLKPAKEVSGTEGGQIDLPAVVVKLTDTQTGQDLGQKLYPTRVTTKEIITSGDRKFAVQLRFERTYKDYTIFLNRIDTIYYPGTETPKSYESHVTLEDPSANEKREVRIWMNNPLRYKGDTLYQSGAPPKDHEGTRYTVLQVVKNPGSTMPYWSCAIITLGMLVHFLIKLFGFSMKELNRNQTQTPQPTASAGSNSHSVAVKRKWLVWGMPTVLFVLCALMVGGKWFSSGKPKEGQFDFTTLGKIPVQHNGRVQPLDTLARSSLMVWSEGKQEFIEDYRSKSSNGKSRTGGEPEGIARPAVQLFFDLAAGIDRIEDHEIFRVNNLDLLQMLELPPRPGWFRYSLADLSPKLQKVFEVAAKAKKKSKEERTELDVKCTELVRNINALESIRRQFDPGIIPVYTDDGKWLSVMDLQKKYAPDVREQAEKEAQLEMATITEEELENRLLGIFKLPKETLIQRLGEAKLRDFRNKQIEEEANSLVERTKISKAAALQKATLLVDEQMKKVNNEQLIQVIGRDDYKKRLEEIREQLFEDRFTAKLIEKTNQKAGEESPQAAAYFQLLKNYKAAREKQIEFETLKTLAKNRETSGGVDTNQLNQLQTESYQAVAEFNAQAQDYLRQFGSAESGLFDADTVKKVLMEANLNRFDPFLQCLVLYIVMFLLAVTAWVFFWNPTLSKTFVLSAVAVGLVTFTVHTWGGVMRMMIAGRPPVTNLYSSAIFIGWGSILVCFILELFTRRGFASAAGAALGFGTMIISRHLAVTGDTLEQMQAVLDTNFWLATHVVIVTIGYVASLLAGALGLIYLCLGMCTPILRDREVNRLFNAVIYGVVCFGMLTSFVGTVLGGIWADQSWGRFWGWDPKENGAVLVVIWNALILHARWGGMIKQRGVAVMSIFGAAVTVWSWFGTNQLGIGLHAYGFNATLATGCAVAWVFCAMFCLVGMLIPTRYWYSFAPQVPVIKK